MNTKTKELIALASTTYYSGLGERDEVDLQKLVELVVLECAALVWYSREDSINGNVSEVIKHRIKQHFGVTE
jgi:predicted Zn-dependent protease with MMP-like domain